MILANSHMTWPLVGQLAMSVRLARPVRRGERADAPVCGAASERLSPLASGTDRVVRDLPAITEANHVTGTFDYLMRADLPDTASLDRLLRELKRRAGVAATSTRAILRTTLAQR